MKTLVQSLANITLAFALGSTVLPASAAELRPSTCLVRDADASIRLNIPAERSGLSTLEGWSGIAVVRIALDENGVAHDPAILESSGSAYLDFDALKAAVRQVYAPATHACTPSGGVYRIIVDFTN